MIHRLTAFNDCKFVITPSMKFGIAKLPKIFYKNPEKKFKRMQKTTTKNYKHNQG